MSQQGYTPPVRIPAPPLTPRQRTGALIAGGVGFTLVQLGLGLLVIITVIGVIALVFSLVFGFIARAGGGSEGFTQFVTWLHTIDVVTVTVVAVIAALLGVLLAAAGILASRWILTAHGVNRPTAVTWSALGISFVANWMVGGFGFSASGVFGDRLADSPLPWVVGSLGLLVSIAIGVFAWWWMAHVYRARITAGTPVLPAAPSGP